MVILIERLKGSVKIGCKDFPSKEDYAKVKKNELIILDPINLLETGVSFEYRVCEKE